MTISQVHETHRVYSTDLPLGWLFENATVQRLRNALLGMMDSRYMNRNQPWVMRQQLMTSTLGRSMPGGDIRAQPVQIRISTSVKSRVMRSRRGQAASDELTSLHVG
jgi:hypothetical protein